MVAFFPFVHWLPPQPPPPFLNEDDFLCPKTELLVKQISRSVILFQLKDGQQSVKIQGNQIWYVHGQFIYYHIES